MSKEEIIELLELKIGTVVIASQEIIAFKVDWSLPPFYGFTVDQFYPDVFTMTRRAKNGSEHRQSLSYSQLWVAYINNKAYIRNGGITHGWDKENEIPVIVQNV